MFELFLTKTPNKEASPVVARKPRHPAKKFSSQFLICARRFFSSKRKRKLLCGVLLLTSRTAGLSAFCIRSGVAEFPPNPPSATPSRGRFFFSAEFEAVPISLVHHPFLTQQLFFKHFFKLFTQSTVYLSFVKERQTDQTKILIFYLQINCMIFFNFNQ